MELSTASFAYPDVDGIGRAALAERLAGSSIARDCFVLTSCLRSEIVVPGSVEKLDEVVAQLLGDLGDRLEPKVRHGDRAVAHIFRIAAGLESPILGEHEILTQFRQGLIEAEEQGTVGGVFARLLESAIAVGRQARELIPGTPHNSMAAVAAQAVGSASRVAVLGSGVMAVAVVDGLLQLPAPPEIVVVARNPEKVPEREGVAVLGFEHAEAVMAEFPAVISATSAKRRLIEDETMARIVASRREAMFLVDMAMPPDFSPPGTPLVTYLSIDDLARMADRRKRTDEADEFVESAAREAHRQYRDHHEIGPLVGQLVDTADETVEAAVRKFSGRLTDPADSAVLRQAAHTVARRILADPISYLKSADRTPDAIDVIAAAFAVDERSAGR